MTNNLLKTWLFPLFWVSALLLTGPAAHGAVLTADTVWRGNVTVSEDVLVPAGVTLTVAAGTHVKVVAAESTKTDPEYLSPLTEITIRGKFKVEGTPEAGVDFSSASGKSGSWAGVIIDGGSASIASGRIGGADTAIQLINGSLNLDHGTLTGNRYGLVATGKSAAAQLTNSRIAGNDYGLFLFGGAEVTRLKTEVADNRKKDLYERPAVPAPATKAYVARELPIAREYGDEVLAGETVWQGRIRVNGVIRVPEDGRLVILPGTIVEFGKKDTNGDGIGENGLLVQGRLLAKGTATAPIFFRSAEKHPLIGDWDAINIMNSDGSQNLMEYCQVEDAYRGAHFHFSNLSINHSIFRHNYRGIQFQESAVELRDSWVYGNKNGMQGRDSTVVLANNWITANYDGANLYRVNLTANGNRFFRNMKEGLRLRDSTVVLTENLIDGNRFGLMVADTFQGSYKRNAVSANSEFGISLKNIDNLEIAGNFITANGFNGLNIQETRATIQGNLFAGNGERGVGIQSFSGVLSRNNFAANGLFAIDYEGTADLAAPDNWWGGSSPEKVIGDKGIDPKRGRVGYAPASPAPHLIAWPLAQVVAGALWQGAVKVDATVSVPKGGSLVIAPGTRVLFRKDAGLSVQGTLIAQGNKEQRITFTAQEPAGDSSWGEILLEYSAGSRITYCTFEYATWGLHSHFTPLTLANNIFRYNYGGMRFRSGPMQIIHSVFSDNTIGIRSYRGNAVIRENRITGNETGIFVREKGGGLTISANNLAGNRGYGIRVGDFNNEDISAGDNWWGQGDPSQYLFDGRSEPGIGIVRYEPYRREPVNLESAKP